MISEYLNPKRGTFLRKNGNNNLLISIKDKFIDTIFLINENSFITNDISDKHLKIAPKDHYMIINNGNNKIQINYDRDISMHKVIYDPYKYELSKKVNFEPNEFVKKYNVPIGFVDTLAKWYSIKFTYPDHNLIYIKPEMGISIQIHHLRNETWEILRGKPIIINGNKVYYYVNEGAKFSNLINTYHSIINPNKVEEHFVIIKESWDGEFDENDIKRIYNPNHYY